MQTPSREPSTVRRLALTVRGVVQGVGFRPFVYQAARSRGLTGWVRNEADLVRIEVEGDSSDLDAFLDVLRHAAPPPIRIQRLDVAETPRENGDAAGGVFQIEASAGGMTPQPTIPADLAICAECLAEIRDPAERRYQYPFTNCTNCGPRWSIIRRVPYDRPWTSMAEFAMCPECLEEYHDPENRRFHAQPIACARCGPTVQLMDSRGKELAVGTPALDAAAQAILTGRVLALKGLGGFQLLVDATSAEAVDLLRRRKHRPDRPLALMFPSLAMARLHCELSDAEAHALSAQEAPILLLRRLPPGVARGSLPAAIAPGNPYLGVMLPYTPLHHLLMDRLGRPIVCTSGNLAEEPMAIDTEDALRRLGPIADCLLTHNRAVVRPVDDSVARIGTDGFQVLRRARGYAPLPVTLPFASPTILAAGGHLKNAVALAIGTSRETQRPAPVVLGAHIGDLESAASIGVFHRAIDDLLAFFQTTPEAVACDLHPDYASTCHAEALASRWGVPLVRVQHHHAHVAACMAEHGLAGPVLGLAWDGTGYGSDGTIWGGEALLCNGAEFRRVAHLRTFALPGGDRAVREPRRSALGLLHEFLGKEAAACEQHTQPWFTDVELKTLLSMLARALNSPRTSSMGRLFDAVAALCGLPRAISFEGQAAMALEFAADPNEQDAYALPLTAGPARRAGLEADLTSRQQIPRGKQEPQSAPENARDDSVAIADWEPLVRAVLLDRAAGVPMGRISARFHNALAQLAVDIARRTETRDVVLSGGCFQNALLLERVRWRLLAAGFSVYTHHIVPPGDGGIALGQIYLAARQLQGASHVPGNTGKSD